ncbi:MAG: type II toxin-antitoxin system VapC family toxin [Aigarchaeota archaeon]|nr:type II toxin-antitoxin system VapC family toxin [Candidatus Pelearchaeum maunauluense]
MEKALILDASIAVKWFTAEPLRDKALIIRDRYVRGEDLQAPSLLYYEVANALRYNPRFGSADVRAAIRALEDPAIIVHEFKGSLASRAIELAYMYGIMVYDAAYVALAEMENATPYTADKEVVAKLMSENIRHLSEIRS